MHKATPSLILACLCLLPAAALAQAPLYSNANPGDASTPALNLTPVSQSGADAPAGMLWSEAADDTMGAANAAAGFANELSGVGAQPFRFADDFTVPADRSWRIGAVTFYAFQTGYADDTVSPFGSMNLRIWIGPPGDPESFIIAGDTTTNRLVSSTPTSIHRIFNTSNLPGPVTEPQPLRRVWASTVAIDIELPPGTYWLDWQYTCTDPNAQAFSPPATVPFKRTSPGWNARWLTADGEWAPLLDFGKPMGAPDVPQDMPFIIYEAAPCIADFNNDSAVDDLDIAAFFAAFETGDADVDGSGSVDDLDILAFFQRFEQGC